MSCHTARGRAADDLDGCLGQGCFAFGSAQPFLAGKHFGKTTGIGCNNNSSISYGFDGSKSETFTTGGHPQEVEILIDGGQSMIGWSVHPCYFQL